MSCNRPCEWDADAEEFTPNPYQEMADAQVRAGAWPGALLLSRPGSPTQQASQFPSSDPSHRGTSPTPCDHYLTAIPVIGGPGGAASPTWNPPPQVCLIMMTPASPVLGSPTACLAQPSFQVDTFQSEFATHRNSEEPLSSLTSTSMSAPSLAPARESYRTDLRDRQIESPAEGIGRRRLGHRWAAESNDAESNDSTSQVMKSAGAPAKIHTTAGGIHSLIMTSSPPRSPSPPLIAKSSPTREKLEPTNLGRLANTLPVGRIDCIDPIFKSENKKNNVQHLLGLQSRHAAPSLQHTDSVPQPPEANGITAEPFDEDSSRDGTAFRNHALARTCKMCSGHEGTVFGGVYRKPGTCPTIRVQQPRAPNGPGAEVAELRDKVRQLQKLLKEAKDTKPPDSSADDKDEAADPIRDAMAFELQCAELAKSKGLAAQEKTHRDKAAELQQKLLESKPPPKQVGAIAKEFDEDSGFLSADKDACSGNAPWSFLPEFCPLGNEPDTVASSKSSSPQSCSPPCFLDLANDLSLTTDCAEFHGEIQGAWRKLSHMRVPKTVDLTKKFGSPAEGTTITTLMLRNIPNTYSRKMLCEELDHLGFGGEYDFIYLPIDKSTSWNVGYAFVNFISASVALHFRSVMSSHKYQHSSHQGHTKMAQVSVAHIQGFANNMKHYSNTAVQCTRVQAHRPLVLVSKEKLVTRRKRRSGRGKE